MYITGYARTTLRRKELIVYQDESSFSSCTREDAIWIQ